MNYGTECGFVFPMQGIAPVAVPTIITGLALVRDSNQGIEHFPVIKLDIQWFNVYEFLF